MLNCLFYQDCLWRERTSIYSWYLPCFAGDALSRLTGDARLALSMTPSWLRPCSGRKVYEPYSG